VKSWLTSLCTSKTAVALLVAVLVNVWLGVGHPLSRVPTANLDTGEVQRAITAFKREHSSPSIVFLGSSLVLAPMMQAEANFLGTPVERMNHRRSFFMEAQLSDLPRKPSVFNLAIGGAMVSDAYLLVKNILKGEQQPDAIVFGIAPRDFQDNLLPGIQSTESFRVLAQPEDCWELLRKAPLSYVSTCELLLTQYIPLWKYRQDICAWAVLRGKKTMEACMPWVVFDKYGETLELKPRRHGQFPEEVKGTPRIFPNVAMNHTSREKTRDEYNTRYNPLNKALVDQEFAYFDELLALCKERGIKVMMINMPLSAANLALVPPGFYAYYKERLGPTCKAHDAKLVDMCNQTYSSDSLFADGVHLDTGVSRQFLEEVVREFQVSRVASAFNKSI
jgi:DltD protein